MRIAIVGLGGIGGFVGAHLARKYSGKGIHTIIFIQRGEHAQAIQNKGLEFRAKESFICNPDELYSQIELVQNIDILIVCTKSKDLEQTIELAKNSIHSNTQIITLLNGVQNADRIQKILPNNRVLEGCIYVSAAIISPGIVSQKGGAGTIFIGPLHDSVHEIDKEFQTICNTAGLKVELTEQIAHEVWRKYLFICPFASMTTLYNLPIGLIVRNQEQLEQTRLLMDEIVKVGNKFSANLNQSHVDAAIDLAFRIPESTPSSMQLDVYSGKYPEIDIFAQNVVNLAQQMHVNVFEHTKILPRLMSIIKQQIHA